MKKLLITFWLLLAHVVLAAAVDENRNKTGEVFSIKDGFLRVGNLLENSNSISSIENGDEEVAKLFSEFGREITVKSSFFKSLKDVYFSSGDSFPEALRRIAFSRGNAKIVNGDCSGGEEDCAIKNNPAIDLNNMELFIDKPIYFHRIAADGSLEVSKENNVTTTAPIYVCGRQLYEAKFPEKLAGYPSVESSIANFYLRKPLAIKSIRVHTLAKKQFVKCNDADCVMQSNGGSEVNFFLYELDLNADGVPDLLVYNYSVRGGLGGLNANWRRYINVNQHWYLVDINYEEDCV